jgi:crotonobetaine/carnitine-CoA ligase
VIPYDLSRPLTRDECVLRNLLERWADETPDACIAVFEDTRFTYKEFLRETRRGARALQDLGIRHGDHVFVWLPNGPTITKLWFALNYIGAIFVPANTAYRGALLEHVLKNVDARIAIVHADLAPRLLAIDCANLETAVVVGGELEGPCPPFHVVGENALSSTEDQVLPLDRPIEPWDTQSIIYTSGTTGPSKGVLSSYAHLHYMGLGVISNADNVPYLTAADRFLISSPLFHVGGTSPIYGMLAIGGSFAVLDSFDTGSFWEKVNRSASTAVVLLGVMASFLVKRPPRSDDQASTLRHAFIVPLTSEGVAFGERFGVRTYTQYSMTEISVPLKSDENPSTPGICGRRRVGVELRIVDANDCEVPLGSVGELVLRTSQPWLLSHGYNNDFAATARAWRNGWFHTGDGFRREEDGSYVFVDRFKDAIRRRGENVSSFEVEMEVSAFPSVKEAAAIAVPSEYGEDEILVAVAPNDGQAIDKNQLIRFLQARMAYLMVPRYVRVVGELPKTPTGKVEKFLLRAAGITDDTWDRESAGIKIGRERFGDARSRKRS